MIVGGFLARYPPRTRKLYAIHLRQWVDWCQLHGLDPLEAKRGHIEAWGRHVTEERGLKPASLAGKFNAVCGMYKFANVDELLDHDPGAYVRRPKIEFVTTSNALTRTELSDMVDAAKAESPTVHALICILGFNGTRIGETVAANVEHLGWQSGYRTIHLPDRKGGRVGTLSLAIPTAYAIDRMLDGRDTGPLFLQPDGRRVSAGSVRRTVERLTREVGVSRADHPALAAPHVRHPVARPRHP